MIYYDAIYAIKYGIQNKLKDHYRMFTNNLDYYLNIELLDFCLSTIKVINTQVYGSYLHINPLWKILFFNSCVNYCGKELEFKLLTLCSQQFSCKTHFRQSFYNFQFFIFLVSIKAVLISLSKLG